jgi:hypothetical protein
MRASYVNESNHLRERAAEIRESSKELKDNNTVAVIMRLADLYDRLADRAERRRDQEALPGKTEEGGPQAPEPIGQIRTGTPTSTGFRLDEFKRAVG